MNLDSAKENVKLSSTQNLTSLKQDAIEHLASQILYHKKLYYKGNSVISDAEYDALEDELKKLSPLHPVLNYVGYIDSKKGKINRKIPMLSLAKTYEIKDLVEFINKYGAVVVVDKFDGMALSLEYDKEGKLFRASTRGNGLFGEDVTEHIFHIPSIPKVLQNTHSAEIEIRGEIFFPLSSFENFIEEFDSFRNSVPGLLGRKDVENAAHILRNLKFYPYDFLAVKNGQYLSTLEISENFHIENTYSAKMSVLELWHFSFQESPIFKVSEHNVNLNEIEQIVNQVFTRKRDYKIDGIVFRIDSEKLKEELGTTSHHPRSSLAFKKAGETSETEIIDIEQNIGRSGKVTFRAKLKPVNLSGAKISYATLHNADFIESGPYNIGAKVEIIRSGEVIPAILKRLDGGTDTFKLPTRCLCGNSLVRNGPDLFCMEQSTCYVRDQESLVYFVSSLEILGVSDKIILKLRAAGLVLEPADLFKLTYDDVVQLEGFAEKSAKNLIETIQSKKQIPLWQFLTALGLKRGGEVKCREVAKEFKSLKNVRALIAEDLLQLRGWAEKSAEDFVTSLKIKSVIIEHLLKYVVVLDDTSSEKINRSSFYFGKMICVTGTLSRPRDEIKRMLESVGAKVVSSVSAKTDFLVCNEVSHSSKYKEAVKLGVKIINEQDLFQNLLN